MATVMKNKTQKKEKGRKKEKERATTSVMDFKKTKSKMKESQKIQTRITRMSASGPTRKREKLQPRNTCMSANAVMQQTSGSWSSRSVRVCVAFLLSSFFSLVFQPFTCLVPSLNTKINTCCCVSLKTIFQNLLECARRARSLMAELSVRFLPYLRQILRTIFNFRTTQYLHRIMVPTTRSVTAGAQRWHHEIQKIRIKEKLV